MEDIANRKKKEAGTFKMKYEAKDSGQESSVKSTIRRSWH